MRTIRFNVSPIACYEGLGHTGNHEVIVVPALHLAKATALIQMLRRILRMYGE